MNVRAILCLALAVLILSCCGPLPMPDQDLRTETAPSAGQETTDALPQANAPTAAPIPSETQAQAAAAAPSEGAAATQAGPPTSSPVPVASSPSPPPAGPTPTPTSQLAVLPPGAPAAAPAWKPDSECDIGPPPSSVSIFPTQSSIVYEGQIYFRVGRSLMVNFQLVDSEGTTSTDLVRIQAASCSIDGALRYDWVYTEYFALQCPRSLADFEEPESGPWDVYVVGRRFYRDGVLVDSEGSTSEETYEETGRCAGHDFRYVVFLCVGPQCVPESDSLILLGGGLSLVAALAAWQLLRRREGQARR